MKVIAYSLLALLFFGLLNSQRAAPEATDQKAKEMNSKFATHRLWSKDGIGLVNKHLYLAVKSASDEKNEIIGKPTPETEERWHGKSIRQPEVAIFYEGRIWSTENLPEHFDLSKAVVVSFEKDKVRFFDFQLMAGGYYDRIAE